MSLDVHCSLLAHENCACYNANLEALNLQATVANVIILFVFFCLSLHLTDVMFDCFTLGLNLNESCISNH